MSLASLVSKSFENPLSCQPSKQNMAELNFARSPVNKRKLLGGSSTELTVLKISKNGNTDFFLDT